MVQEMNKNIVQPSKSGRQTKSAGKESEEI